MLGRGGYYSGGPGSFANQGQIAGGVQDSGVLTAGDAGIAYAFTSDNTSVEVASNGGARDSPLRQCSEPC